LVFAHVAGIPVEETALSLAPVGVVALTVGARSYWQKLKKRVRRSRS
jgi:hypothetical protein